MKYPPVVSTLQEWLDGKIGTQGLDAVSCAFYVLSLLQGEQADEPEAFCQFPHSKVVDEPGLSCWPRDGWSTWGLGDTLAAKSLLTPVQGYELELLGNELSPHLKSTQNEDRITNVAQHCLCTKQNYSLPAGNKIENCCESFSGEALCNDVGSIGEQSNTLHANESACVGFFKHKLEGKGLIEKANSPFMAEAMKTHEEEELVAGNRRSLFAHDQELVWGDNPTGLGMPWNEVGDGSSSNFSSILKQGTQVPGVQELWEADTLFKEFQGSVPSGMPYVGTGNKIGDEGLSDKHEDDRSLAQLIAKFDHSIAAIWNLGNSRPLQYDIDDQPEFSWDIHNLLSSSQDDSIKLELKCFNNSEPASEENSFIHCGTNITSSIWSDQSVLGNLAGQDDSGTKFVDEGVSILDGCVNEDHSDLCCKLKVLLATDGLLQNEFNLFEWNSGTIGTSVKDPYNPAGNFIQKDPEECSDNLWSKIQTFPSLFSDVSFQEQFCHVENIEDANGANPQDENSCMISCSPCPVSLFGNSSLKNYQNVIGNGNRNFNTLNHNREDSSFTEVIPRLSGEKKVVNDSKASYPLLNQTKPSLDGAGQTSEESENNYENSGKKDEEEDLLTSTRTHFRPIHQDLVDPHNNPGTHYADGTTFLITSSFMDVPFKRSESGTLFMESNDARDTPKIYMEYKERAGNIRGSRFLKDNTAGSKGTFIPKFCVRHIEKYCQTEESAEISEEINFKRIKHNNEEDKNNLFFSDEEIVKSVADYLDDDYGKFEDIDCKDNQHKVGMDDTLTLNMRNEEISKSFESETYIWNKAGCKCNNNYLFSSKSDSLGIFGASVLSEKEGLWSLGGALSCQSQYSIWSCSPLFGPPGTPLGGSVLGLCASCESASLCERRERCALREELRSELSADGEQLLSDLRSLQHMQFEGGGGNEHSRLNRKLVKEQWEQPLHSKNPVGMSLSQNGSPTLQESLSP